LFTGKSLNLVSFSVQQNERICIVSDTSSTINSLFYLLTGICEKQSGIISLDKIPFENINLLELRNQIGTVLSSDQLIDVSIEDNIRFGNNSLQLAQIVEVTSELGLTDFINQCADRFATLLNNEVHFLPKECVFKLLFARAIVKNPRLILLDEPTAAMTASQKKPLLNYFEHMKNTTILMASNDQDVQKMADRILKFENGTLVFDGNYETFSKL
jgi:ABC-type multidrug transport system fused ATPase/permease subunit